MKYTYWHDDGHGWLEVPLVDLFDLGIADDISMFSYMRRRSNLGLAYTAVFLEEDADMGKFLHAHLEKRGMLAKYDQVYAGHRAVIWDYPHYSAEHAARQVQRERR